MRYIRSAACAGVTAATLLVAACASVERSAAPQAAAVTSTTLREREPEANAARFAIIPSQSEIRVLTYRDGALAHLGHNHVIVSDGVTGSVWLGDDVAAGLVRIVVPASSLAVDDDARRAEAGEGFADPVPDDAKRATRDNMLSEQLLNADDFAFVQATCGDIRNKPETTIDCVVELAGKTVTLTMPLVLDIGDTRISARGEVTVTHEQLGLTPFSAAGGAIRVADGMTLGYSIVAQRLSD